MNRVVYSNKKTKKIKLALTGLGLGLAVSAMFFAFETRPIRLSRSIASIIPKAKIAQVLGKRLVTAAQEQDGDLSIQYSIDARLQQAIEQVYKHSHVPYGAFVAMDPKTGQILSMVSHGMGKENLAIRSTFPAASIFKVITAAAALERGRLQHNSLIPVRGSYHTLYRQNVLKGGGIDPEKKPRFARLITFEEALAKSVNSVFGKVGIFGIGSDGLRKIATRFQFGREIPFELPVEQSLATVPDGDDFGIAEAASGYTKLNTLSPVHGAMIASAVANGGILMEPSIVSKITSKDGKLDYQFEQRQLATVIEKPVAEELATMMHKTITDGTSRRAFSHADRSVALSDVFIAGKTGTLNGWSPAGRYDWFVGFAEKQTQKIAVAALCIHSERHGMKASQVARAAFETFFGNTIATVTPLEGSGSRHRRRHRKSRHNNPVVNVTFNW